MVAVWGFLQIFILRDAGDLDDDEDSWPGFLICRVPASRLMCSLMGTGFSRTSPPTALADDFPE